MARARRGAATRDNSVERTSRWISAWLDGWVPAVYIFYRVVYRAAGASMNFIRPMCYRDSLLQRIICSLLHSTFVRLIWNLMLLKTPSTYTAQNKIVSPMFIYNTREKYGISSTKLICNWFITDRVFMKYLIICCYCSWIFEIYVITIFCDIFLLCMV